MSLILPMTRITPSLYEAWRWYLRLDKEDQDLLDTLNRVPHEPTEAMTKGILFEQHVAEYEHGLYEPEPGHKPDYQDSVREMADIVKGGVWQQSLSKPYQGMDGLYLLTGRADVIKRDWIYDIKFTKKYEIGKYVASIQHLLYMYASNIPNCAYLICDGNNVYREDYHWDDHSRDLLFTRINLMMNFIMDTPIFRTAYLQHWQQHHDHQKEAA